MRSIWASAEVYCIFPAGFMLLNVLLFHSLPSVGMKFLEDCPIQTLIPLYLLAGGIIGALKVKSIYPLFSFCRNLTYRHVTHSL